MSKTEVQTSGMAVSVSNAAAGVSASATGEVRLSTPGGRYQMRRGDIGRATARGQFALFAEPLEVSDLSGQRAGEDSKVANATLTLSWHDCLPQEVQHLEETVPPGFSAPAGTGIQPWT